ncbi:hypothetical protein SO802_031239 [Lithocarpus litseifolius]|uniref:Uncharacterized protein n=1 Tax=Lithocarpus litseifolius TaxID=425828 RepID=A0AAW2BL43_9ROSI
MRLGAIPDSKRESKLDQNSNTDLAPKRAIRHMASAHWPKLLARPKDPLIEWNGINTEVKAFGKTVKKATTQVPIILAATPPFGLGYKPTDDDLLKIESPYGTRTSDEDKKGEEAPSDDDEGSNSKSDGSNDSCSNDDGDGEDHSHSDSESNNGEDYDSQYSGNDCGEPPSDRENEDEGPFYEDHFDDNMDYYDGDTENDVEVEPIDMESGAESEEYELENVLEAVGDEVEEADYLW